MISLSWTSAGSMVDSYEVMWQRDTSGVCPYEDEGSTTLTDGSTTYTITGLEESSNYTITLIATNAIKIANSNNVTGFTQESAPSTAPTFMSVSEVTSFSITVQWGEVDCIHCNGDITGYTLKCSIG